MKGRAVIPLAVGLAIGVFALKYFVSMVKKAKGASTETVQVICAGSDIEQAVEITDPMLDVKSLPRALAPKMYVADRKELVGRVTGQKIVTGMPIVETVLAPKGTPAGLSGRIPDNYRAFTVQVDEFTGVGGWLKPGSHVDVVAILTGRTSNENLSRVILENVEVLTVGQDAGSKSDATASVPKSVTLAVLPKQMPTLHLAASTKGKIRLVMRNQTDTKAQARGFQATDNELYGDNSSGGKKGGLSFLGGMASLMSKVPKTDDKATDKEPRAREPKAQSTPVAAPAEKCEWVQVYRGSEFQEELGFSRVNGSWRLVATRDRKSLQGNQDPGLAALSPFGQDSPSQPSRQLD